MDKRELKEYLGMIVDMEAGCDLLSRLHKDLTLQIVSIQTPRPQKLALPVQPVKPTKPEIKYTHIPFGTILVFLATWIVSVIVLALIFGSSIIALDILLAILGTLLGADVEVVYDPAIGVASEFGAFLGMFVGAALGFVAASDYNKADKKAREDYIVEQRRYKANLEEYEREFEAYQMEMKWHEEQTVAEQRRVEKEMRIVHNKRSYLRKSLSDLDNKAKESADCLQVLYSRNIVHPKYRGFVSMCSLYEYIDTGVCSELEGDSGAYKWYDQMVIARRIITRLDVIIQQLSTIRDNQYELFIAIQANQRKLDRIEASNRAILAKLDADSNKSGNMQSDEASAYFDERRRTEQRYRNRMDDFSSNQ